MEKIYCVTCRSFTENKGKLTHRTTSTGRKYLLTKCKSCGKEKSKFV